MKNVLICGAKMDKIAVYKCHCADLWWGSKMVTKKEVYAHKNGYLKRTIHINDLFSIVPSFANEDITYKFPEPFDWSWPERHPQVYVNPITMAIEMPIEEAENATTVRDFVEKTVVFWDVIGEKKFLADELVEVWVDKRTHSITITAKELLEKYGDKKIFCYLQCNDYFRKGKPQEHIVLF
jgi:hypothetical protein